MTAEEKARAKVSWNYVKEKYLKFHHIEEFTENMAIDIDFGYWLANEVISEATRWRDPKDELPNRDMQVVIKGGILKNEVGPDIENDYSAGYYYDGVWYVSPTDYYSIEIENPTGWRPIE